MSAACWAGHWGEYHDEVWDTRVTDPKVLFAQLSLCTQQCGVSWRIVWNKRHHYAAAFHDWDLSRVAMMTDADLDALCDREGPWAGKLIQNRGKLNAIMHNARQCAAIDAAVPGGLAAFLWSFVRAAGASRFSVALGGGPDTKHSATVAMDEAAIHDGDGGGGDVNEVTSAFSDRLTAALKGKAGCGVAFEPFKFLGSITLQALLLQNGLLNGHSRTCTKNPRCACITAGGPKPVSPRGRAVAASTCTSTAPSTKGPSTPKRTAAAAALKEPTEKAAVEPPSA